MLTFQLFANYNNHTAIYTTKFLCNCDDCLDFRFDDWCRKHTSLAQSLLNEPEVQDVITTRLLLDAYDKEPGQYVYEFVIIPSFFAVVSYNSCEPVYIINIGTAKEEMKDRYGYSLAPRHLYLKDNYFKLAR